MGGIVGLLNIAGLTIGGNIHAVKIFITDLFTGIVGGELVLLIKVK